MRTELLSDDSDCWQEKYSSEKIVVSSRCYSSSGSLSVGTEGHGDGNLTECHSGLFRMEMIEAEGNHDKETKGKSTTCP